MHDPTANTGLTQEKLYHAKIQISCYIGVAL